MRRIYLIALFFCSLAMQGYGKETKPLNTISVNEAFMNTEASMTFLVTIDREPPAPLQEHIPDQTDPQTVWIPGYWSWSFERNEFMWCSGAWRRPPPNHDWIVGKWKKVEGGWVRIQGFWSSVSEDRLTYINKQPPDPYSEHPTKAPGTDYFWMSGYWKYEGDRYTWLSGKWEKQDQNWIYVPARYMWREQGYVFVAPFWDWPLELRGTAYACTAVSVEQNSIEYLPQMIVEPKAIVEGFMLCYPDYSYFYFYYWSFHDDWWIGCEWCPPWWGWDGWWWMPWGDQWGLWWWWTHPGFEAPFWLDIGLFGMMFGPPMPLVDAMRDRIGPMIIGPHRVIPTQKLWQSLGKTDPVFPKKYRKIQKKAEKGLDKGSTKRPTGPKTPQGKKTEPTPPTPQIVPLPPEDAPIGEQPTRPQTTVTTPVKPEYPSDTVRPSTEPTRTPPVYSSPVQPQTSYPDDTYMPSYQGGYIPPRRGGGYVPPKHHGGDYTPPHHQGGNYTPPRHQGDYTPPKHQGGNYTPPGQGGNYTPRYRPHSSNTAPNQTQGRRR